jgi:hypothetical protein
MNARIKRLSDSENFGARITRNGVAVEKIWAFEVQGGKWSFQEVPGAYLEFLEVWRASV